MPASYGTVASLGGERRWGRSAPGDTLQGVTPDLKLFFVAEFRKNTGQTKWEDGIGEETTAKKVITFRGDD